MALSLASTPCSVAVGVGPSDYTEKGRCWCSNKFKVPGFVFFQRKVPHTLVSSGLHSIGKTVRNSGAGCPEMQGDRFLCMWEPQIHPNFLVLKAAVQL